MSKSMTGYGRCVKVFDDYEITVEIKSVNHRYFEFSCRIPKQYSFMEERLKKLVSSAITRGKTECCVLISPIGGPEEEVKANAEIIFSYISALRDINASLGLTDDLSLSCVMRIPDAFTVTRREEDEEELWEKVKACAEDAINVFCEARAAEGEKLDDDILLKLEEIESGVNKVAERSPEVTAEYQNRLYRKLMEILEDKNIDTQRLITEAAIFADKTAVDEEIVRLRSHICQCRQILGESGAIGKRLDFLIQEFNREVNTIGSKCCDLEITKTVLNMKNTVEKIREQIQNIE